jgi:hypothetical protein
LFLGYGVCRTEIDIEKRGLIFSDA